jgi:hypothetical protein
MSQHPIATSRPSRLVAAALVLVVAWGLLHGGSPAPRADAAGTAKAAAPATGRYVGHLYEGTPPAEGWPIRLKVVRRDGRRVIKGWGRSVVFTCYSGPSVWTQSVGFWVPRTTIRRQRAVRTWRTPGGVVGELRLRFKGSRARGTLEYQASNCYLLYNRILVRHRR